MKSLLMNNPYATRHVVPLWPDDALQALILTKLWYGFKSNQGRSLATVFRAGWRVPLQHDLVVAANTDSVGFYLQ